jgi:hypothetical protein
MPCRAWTADEDEQLRRDYRIVATGVLAARFGRSPQAVRIHAYRIRIARRQFDPDRETLELLRLLHACGRSDPEIASTLGTTRATILNWRRKLKLHGWPYSPVAPKRDSYATRMD